MSWISDAVDDVVNTWQNYKPQEAQEIIDDNTPGEDTAQDQPQEQIQQAQDDAVGDTSQQEQQYQDTPDVEPFVANAVNDVVDTWQNYKPQEAQDIVDNNEPYQDTPQDQSVDNQVMNQAQQDAVGDTSTQEQQFQDTPAPLQNYWQGMADGANEFKAARALAIYANNNPNATENDKQYAAQHLQDATYQAIAPLTNVFGLIPANVTQLAALPSFLHSVGQSYEKGKDNVDYNGGGVIGGVKQAAWDNTIGPAYDFATDPNLAEKYQNDKWGTIIDGIMSAMPLMMIGHGAVKAGKVGIEGLKDYADKKIDNADVQPFMSPDSTGEVQPIVDDVIEQYQGSQQLKDVQPDSQSSSDLLSQAHEAAMNDDYDTAVQLAQQAGADDWAKSYKMLADNPDVDYSKIDSGESVADNSSQQLADGYKTQSGNDLSESQPYEFVYKPDGSIDFGEIPPDVAESSQITPGKILLQVGKDSNGVGFGLVHIKNREPALQKLGFDSAENFIDDTLQNYNEIRENQKGRLLLVKRGSPNQLSSIELQPVDVDGQRFYSVITAMPVRTKNEGYFTKNKLLYERSPSLSSYPDTEATSELPSQNVGEMDSGANGKSSSVTNNIQQNSNLFNGKEYSRTFQPSEQTDGISMPDDSQAVQQPIEEPKTGFIHDDVIPAAKKVFDTSKETIDDIRNTLAPASSSDAAKLTSGVMRENLADMAQKGDRGEAALHDARDYFAGQKPGDNYDFINRIETGQKQVDPKMQGFADALRDLLDQGRQEIQDLGTGKLQNFIENYFPHMWEDPKKATNFVAQWLGKRPMEGNRSFLKKRTVPTTMDGIAAGLKPISDNPVDLALMKKREMDKYVMAHKTLNELKDKGLVRYVGATDTEAMKQAARDNYAQLDDRIGTVYGAPTIDVKEAYDKQIMDGLNRVAQKLGIDHTRDTRIMKGPDSSGVWGWSQASTGKVATKFGGPESVLAHEIGHQIDAKYHMTDIMKAHYDPTIRAKINAELEQLANKRSEFGANAPDREYLQKPTEQMAAILESYIHAPELLKKTAPTVYKEFNKFLDAHPELQELRKIKPSLQLGENIAKQYISGLRIKGNYYLPADAARIINNYLSPGLRDKSAIFRGYLGAANVMNQFQLGMSAFHLGFTSVDAATSKLALGLYKASHGDVLSGLKDIKHTPIAPVENMLRGRQLYDKWMGGRQSYNNGLSKAAGKVMDAISTTDPRLNEILDGLIAGGGRVKMDDMYQTKIAQKMVDAFKQGNYVGGVLRAPFAVMEKSVEPILNYIVPRQKLGVFADMMRYEMERKPNMSRDELRETAGKIWNSVDNRLGQLVYDNLFWNKTVKDLAMASTRSVGWNLGTFRELGGAGFDTAQQLGRLVTKKKAEMTYRMSYAAALPLFVGTLGALTQYLYTGQGPQEMKDYFFPKTGTLDKNGRPQRISLPSYMKDVTAYYEHAGQTLANKLHPMLATIAEMLQNKDFYGTRIRNVDDPWYAQLGQLGEYAAKSFVPFSWRGSKQQADLGSPLLNRVLPFIGITPAPSDINQTDAEKQAFQYSQARSPVGTRTQEQNDKRDLKQSIVRDVQANGGPTQSLYDALAAKQISPAEAKQITNEARLTPLQRSVSHLPIDQALNVYEKSTPDEQQSLQKIMQQHLVTFGKTSTPEQRQVMNQRLNQVMGKK